MIQARTIYKGNSEKGKAAIIQDLISCLAEVEQQLRGNEGDSWRAELGRAKWQLETTKAELNETKWQLITARAELGRTRERIEGLEARIAMYREYIDALENNTAHGLSGNDIKLLLQLCHPDKHNGSAASEKATQLLLGLRQKGGTGHESHGYA